MLGTSTQLADTAWADVRDLVRKSLLDNELCTPTEWDDTWADAEVHKYSRATLVGGTTVSSTAYGRQQTRNGSRVLLYWETGNAPCPAAAEVDYFLQLRPRAGDAPPGSSEAAAGGSAVVQVAILREFKMMPLRNEPDIADLVLEARDEFQVRSDGSVRVRAVPLHLIEAGLHSARSEEGGLRFAPVVGRSRKIQFQVCKHRA